MPVDSSVRDSSGRGNPDEQYKEAEAEYGGQADFRGVRPPHPNTATLDDMQAWHEDRANGFAIVVLEAKEYKDDARS